MGLLLRSSPLSGSTEGERVGETVMEEVDMSVVIHNAKLLHSTVMCAVMVCTLLQCL